MGTDQGNREAQGEEHLQYFTEEELEPYVCTDPLAQLAADLTVSMLYVEQKVGGFCTDCNCTLGYHCGEIEEDCELCGCYGLHILIYKPLTRIPQFKGRSRDMDTGARIMNLDSTTDIYNQDKEARKVLFELTE